MVLQLLQDSLYIPLLSNKFLKGILILLKSFKTLAISFQILPKKVKDKYFKLSEGLMEELEAR